MQYRYHEWADKILSKRTAESIGSSTLIGLKCGFDVVTVTAPSGPSLAKVSVGHTIKPSNSINDRLHLSPEQQNSLTTVGCLITPDCIITTEDTNIEFNIPTAEWNSKSVHGWLLVATHNYIEISETSSTLQGGSPTTYRLVDVMGVINSLGGLDAFKNGYLLTNNLGTLIGLANSLNDSIKPYNSVVIGFIGNVVTTNPSVLEYTPIYNNVTPLLKLLTLKEYNDILTSVSGVLSAMENLRDELQADMADLESDILGMVNLAINELTTEMESSMNQLRNDMVNLVSSVDIKLTNLFKYITATLPTSENKVLITYTRGAFIPPAVHPTLNAMGLQIPSHVNEANNEWVSSIIGEICFEKTSGGSGNVTGNLYSFVPFKRINYWMKVNSGTIPTTTFTFECFYDGVIVNDILSSGIIKDWASLSFTLNYRGSGD